MVTANSGADAVKPVLSGSAHFEASRKDVVEGRVTVSRVRTHRDADDFASSWPANHCVRCAVEARAFHGCRAVRLRHRFGFSLGRHARRGYLARMLVSDGHAFARR